MAVPDYANQETVSRITANNGTWTVDRPGFVYAAIRANSMASGAHDASVYINSKRVAYDYGWNTTAQVSGLFPVKTGDVILLYANISQDNIICYFIPPLFIEKAQPVISEPN
jgi:hypothetical protein